MERLTTAPSTLMKVSKQQIIDGLSSFMAQNVISNVPNVKLKILLGTLAAAIKRNEKILDSILFNGSGIGMLLIKEDDGYDIETLLTSLKDSIAEYGSFSITIPAIKLISEEDSILTFSASDIEILLQQIIGG